MNRGLLFFALIVIFLSSTSGYYSIAAIGVLLLIPALLTGSTRSTPKPAPARTEPGRVTPRKQPQPFNPATLQIEKPSQHEAPLPTVTTKYFVAQAVATSDAIVPALFPTAMFPSFSPTVSESRDVKPAPEAPGQRDELVETVAALAILRLLTQGT